MTRSDSILMLGWVALGGALGAVLRYLAVTSAARLFGVQFPYGTLAVNVIGSFLIGIIVVLFQSRYPQAEGLRNLLVVGVLGGFTTFSAFSLDTLLLFSNGEHGKALLNVLLNVLLYIAAAAIGFFVSRQVLA